MIHNLLRNAEDAQEHSEAPEIRVETQQNNGRAHLLIADKGSGFPADILPRIFEPYVTTKSGGTGLGLAIVKKIIDEHQGEIKIDSSKEGGAEIHISLPLVTMSA